MSAGEWRVERSENRVGDYLLWAVMDGDVWTADFALEEDARACVETVNARGWRDIASAPKDDTLFLAWCPPDAEFPHGRMMIWKGSLFALQNDRTPNHLRYPATHWMPLMIGGTILEVRGEDERTRILVVGQRSELHDPETIIYVRTETRMPRPGDQIWTPAGVRAIGHGQGDSWDIVLQRIGYTHVVQP